MSAMSSVEEVRRDVEVAVDAVRLLRIGGDAVQHQDRADARRERPRQRSKAGEPGDVQRQLPDRFPAVDHSFTFFR